MALRLTVLWQNVWLTIASDGQSIFYLLPWLYALFIAKTSSTIYIDSVQKMKGYKVKFSMQKRVPYQLICLVLFLALSYLCRLYYSLTIQLFRCLPLTTNNQRILKCTGLQSYLILSNSNSHLYPSKPNHIPTFSIKFNNSLSLHPIFPFHFSST